jgi:hypothetical protein
MPIFDWARTGVERLRRAIEAAAINLRMMLFLLISAMLIETADTTSLFLRYRH